MSDTEVQQLVIYVGTQAKIDEARQAGTIGPDDFVVVTDAPEFALQSTVQAIQVLIPNDASAQNQLVDKNYVDNSTLPSSTKYGASLTLSTDSSDYKVTAILKDQDGNTLGTQQVIDLPLESVVVGGSYDSVNKKIVLTLQNGNTIDVPVGDLIVGLQTEITSQNKLASDLVDDTNQTNKFVTSAEKTLWNNALQPSALNGYATEAWVGQQGYITGITSSMVTTALGYTPYNSTNPSGYQANVIETIKVNGTALTPSSKAVDITVPTNNNQLTNGAGYITLSALSGYATQTWVGNQGYITQAVDDSSTTSTTMGWSASKLNGIIGDIETTINAIRGV